MAIVSMKRLRLFGLLQDRDALFEKLQQLGCVEVSPPDGSLSDPQWASLVRPGERATAHVLRYNPPNGKYTG